MSGCILVVEDQMDNRQILRVICWATPDISWSKRRTAKEALAAVAKQRRT